ncbi:MAG TPA: FMN-binding negative transcriptional regulator [Candidatus Binatia bacterium]|nr:FMN-binding negative transcriptional regulator [Candidatus Binatia bacterium]
MYLPSHFEETRIDVLHELVRQYPLGSLVTLGAKGLNANHIPFELDAAPAPYGTLRGHVARANPVWRDYDPAFEALVIFHGPQVYISPSWYETKKETGEVVPTYNYAVVHAYGRLRIVEDRAWLRGLVARLTERFEGGRAAPWQVSDAPQDFINKQLGAIVGIEIEVSKMLGKWKASQNRPATDRAGVAEALGAAADADSLAMAQMIKERSSP